MIHVHPTCHNLSTRLCKSFPKTLKFAKQMKLFVSQNIPFHRVALTRTVAGRKSCRNACQFKWFGNASDNRNAETGFASGMGNRIEGAALHNTTPRSWGHTAQTLPTGNRIHRCTDPCWTPLTCHPNPTEAIVFDQVICVNCAPPLLKCISYSWILQ